MTCDLTAATHDGLVGLADALAKHPRTTRETLEKSIALMCEDHFMPAPPQRQTLMGCLWDADVPGGGGTPRFAELTGGIMDCVACYPAGRTGRDGMLAVDRAIAAFPTTSINALTLMVGQGVSADDIAKMYQKAAVATGQVLYLKMNGEPDRTDRSYTPAQWHARFDELDVAVGKHAPDVRLVVNLTGYQFDKRIGTWERAFDRERVPVLAVDPYWRPKPSQIQAGEADLAAASQWCADRGIDIAWGEAGVDPGEGHAFRIERFFHWIKDTNPVFVPYFQMMGPWDSRLLTDEEFANYRYALMALRA